MESQILKHIPPKVEEEKELNYSLHAIWNWKKEFNSFWSTLGLALKILLLFYTMCLSVSYNLYSKFDTHGSVHRRLRNRNTNKMQLYYSEVDWRLNMFRAAYRSSSGASNCICSLWFICPYGDRPLPSLTGHWQCPLRLGNGCKAASCWYFYWVIQ